MTTQLPPEFRSKVFEFSAETEAADLWVEETFTNEWGDVRAVLGGDSYGVLIEGGVKDKLDWDITHHKWNDHREEWIVDKDGLDHLAEVAAKDGFTVDTGCDGDDTPETLKELIDFVESGDRVTVEYEKKNGNGRNTYEGEVTNHSVVNTSKNDGYTLKTGDTWGMVFEDTGGKTKYVNTGKFGQAALFSNSQYPFMGNVVSVEVEKA